MASMPNTMLLAEALVTVLVVALRANIVAAKIPSQGLALSSLASCGLNILSMFPKV